MVLLQVRLLFQFFIFFFPNKKRLPLWQPLSLNGKWLSSTIAPDYGRFNINFPAFVFLLITFEILFLMSLMIQYLTDRSEEHTSELQSRGHIVCRLLLEKTKAVVKFS